MPSGSPKEPHRATHVEHPKRPLTAEAAAQLAGNDPLNEGARKADLCRIGLMEAANKVKQAEEKVRKRELRLAELEEHVKELEESKVEESEVEESELEAFFGRVTGSAKRAAEVAQDRVGQERAALELAKRELGQAQSEKQRLSGAGPSTGNPLMRR